MLAISRSALLLVQCISNPACDSENEISRTVHMVNTFPVISDVLRSLTQRQARQTSEVFKFGTKCTIIREWIAARAIQQHSNLAIFIYYESRTKVHMKNKNYAYDTHTSNE